MVRRESRWTWLTAFALANLTCWIGVAVIAGLAIGGDVDLGVESMLREGQITAVAVWKQAAQRFLTPAATPAAMAQAFSPAQVNEPRPAGAAGGAPQTTVSWSAPQAYAVGSEPAATPDASGGSLSSAAVTLSTRPTPQQPDASPVSSPLLLADPEINSLAVLDAEMARSAVDRAVQIRYQEEALNREIAALWTRNPELPFRDVWVDLQRNQVVVTGKTTFLGFGVDAKVTGKVVARDCLPHLRIETVSAAGVMVPAFIKDHIAGMVLEAMTWYPDDYPLCLEQIVLEEARVTAYGHCR
jgi:hypothetical protein